MLSRATLESCVLSLRDNLLHVTDCAEQGAVLDALAGFVRELAIADQPPGVARTDNEIHAAVSEARLRARSGDAVQCLNTFLHASATICYTDQKILQNIVEEVGSQAFLRGKLNREPVAAPPTAGGLRLIAYNSSRENAWAQTFAAAIMKQLDFASASFHAGKAVEAFDLAFGGDDHG